MDVKLLFHHLKMEVPHKNGDFEMIPYSDILYMTYDKPHTTFCYKENGEEKTCIMEVSLRLLEQNLPEVFFRSNPIAILNLCYFRKYKHIGKIIVMENGKEFLLSRRKYRMFQLKKELLPRLSPLCKPCLVCTQACSVRNTFCCQAKNDQIAAKKDQMVNMELFGLDDNTFMNTFAS